MRELMFEAGEFIYRRGDAPDYAFVVVTGEVEIRWPDQMRPPTRLGDGDIFGQIGIMTDQPRGRSAQALSAVKAIGISRADFLDELNSRLDVVEPFLRRLFATLHEVDSLLNPDPAAPSAGIGPTPPAAPTWAAADEEPPDWGGAESEMTAAAIRISAASAELETRIGANGITVDELPFRVGRKPVRGESLPPGGLQLILEDAKPFNLSRRHFSIEPGESVPFVRDTGSHLGTIVNGVRIGGNANARIAALNPGENEIVAGADGSPFKFKVHVVSA